VTGVQTCALPISRKLGKDLKGFLPVSLERLRRYNWPGNVRELQNLIERAAILATGPLVEVIDPLPGHDGYEDSSDDLPPVSATAEDVMRKHILRTLDDCAWIIEGPKGAAAILDMKPSTLRYRMKQLDIRKLGSRAR
jgi:DNA-binding NtrC family response regulator